MVGNNLNKGRWASKLAIAVLLLSLPCAAYAQGEPYPQKSVNIFNISAMDAEILEINIPHLAPGGMGMLTAAVVNNANDTNVSARLQMPAGWASEPAEMNVTLKPGNNTLAFNVTAPADAMNGNYVISLMLSSGGEVRLKTVNVDVRKVEDYTAFSVLLALILAGFCAYVIIKKRSASYKRGAVNILRHTKQRLR